MLTKILVSVARVRTYVPALMVPSLDIPSDAFTDTYEKAIPYVS